MRERLVDLPDPGNRGLQRYSSRPFPPYRYVPGLHPHPTRHRSGHSYQASPRFSRHPPWSTEQWRTLDDWLYGVDLFNRFYFWEAHEAWEGLWAAAERESAGHTMLQGLIQVAAALLKTHMRVALGARVLAGQGVQRLHQVAVTHPALLGLDVRELAGRFTRYFAPLDTGTLPLIGPAVPTLVPTG